MTTPTQPLVLTDADRMKIQSSIFESVHNMTVMDNHGNVIRVNNMTELTVSDIEFDGNSYIITYSHNDPAFQSPATIEIPKRRLGLYFDDDIVSIFLQGEQA